MKLLKFDGWVDNLKNRLLLPMLVKSRCIGTVKCNVFERYIVWKIDNYPGRYWMKYIGNGLIMKSNGW